ncbi:MAG: alpha/beta hydrolase [Actinobacteria bacterium]|nr:alpha/beta hydrolase [Actinomycetota bacterium]
MSVPNLEHEIDLVPSFDGTLIAGRRMGAATGTPLLVAGAVGANLSVWRRTLVDVAPQRPIITWDLRGLHESGIPRSEKLDSAAHAEDGIAIADSLDVDRFHLAGWSTGARIALEVAHRYPERVASLALVCGGYGYSTASGLRHLEVVSLLPAITGVAKRFSGYLGGALRGLTMRPELAGLIRQSGIVGPTADTAALIDLLRSMTECDPHALLSTYEAVAGDDAEAILDEIEASTLLVAGEKDTFTPRRTMERMRDLMPAASLTVYDRATHYLPIEFPWRLAEQLNDFMAASADPP